MYSPPPRRIWVVLYCCPSKSMARWRFRWGILFSLLKDSQLLSYEMGEQKEGVWHHLLSLVPYLSIFDNLSILSVLGVADDFVAGADVESKIQVSRTIKIFEISKNAMRTGPIVLRSKLELIFSCERHLNQGLIQSSIVFKTFIQVLKVLRRPRNCNYSNSTKRGVCICRIAE
jgi:hypothetical protein